VAGELNPMFATAQGRGRKWRAVAVVIGVVSVLTVALTGCTAPGRTSVSDPRLDGTWHLASASDNGLGIPLGGNTITLTIGDATHTGGESPCSTYSATVTGGVGVVYVRARLDPGPRDDCATTQLNDIEKNYLDALTASSYATIDRGSLVLSSPTSYLVFVKSAPTPVVALLNSSWLLYALPTQVPTETSGPGLNPVYLRFDGVGGLTITSPCATFAANYQIEGENFAVSVQHVVAGSPGACSSAERTLAAEAAVLLDGPLLIDVASAGSGDPATLVVTNLDENVPVVWRASE
jgi:heat shock protein HslJ